MNIKIIQFLYITILFFLSKISYAFLLKWAEGVNSAVLISNSELMYRVSSGERNRKSSGKRKARIAAGIINVNLK